MHTPATPHRPPDRIHRLLAADGRYVVERRLASGPHATSFVVRRRDLPTRALVKVVRSANLREAHALAERVIAADVGGDVRELGVLRGRDMVVRLFLERRWVPGLTLEEMVQGGPLAEGQAAVLGAMLAEQLAERASYGVHGGVHPRNVITSVREAPLVTLVDAGWAGVDGTEADDVRALGELLRNVVGGRPGRGLAMILGACCRPAARNRPSLEAVHAALAAQRHDHGQDELVANVDVLCREQDETEEIRYIARPVTEEAAR